MSISVFFITLKKSLSVMLILVLSTGLCASDAREPDIAVLRFPGFDLPPSDFLSPETHNVLLEGRKIFKGCPSGGWDTPEEIYASRKCYDEISKSKLLEVRARYAVEIEPGSVEGVNVFTVTPNEGVLDRNRQRVLLYIPGSGFRYNAINDAQMGAIPVAALGRIQVVGMDYRKAPEFKHPAGIEDVTVVYKELLKKFKPENIGIYGCSAGGALASQTIPWFQKEGLSLPGALGVFGVGLSLHRYGDSWQMLSGVMPSSYAVVRGRSSPVTMHPYFQGLDMEDPEISPVVSPEVVASFPPTLLMTSTRDHMMSWTVFAHTQLDKRGVETDLFVWEGLPHCEYMNANFSEGRDSQRTIIKFFEKHLGS